MSNIIALGELLGGLEDDLQKLNIDLDQTIAMYMQEKEQFLAQAEAHYAGVIARLTQYKVAIQQLQGVNDAIIPNR